MSTSLRSAALAVILACVISTGVAPVAVSAAPVPPSFTLGLPTTVSFGDSVYFGGEVSAPDGASNIWGYTDFIGPDADHLRIKWLGEPFGSWTTSRYLSITPIPDGVRVGFADDDPDGDGVRGFSVPAGFHDDPWFRITVDTDAVETELSYVTTLVTGDDATVISRSEPAVLHIDDPDTYAENGWAMYLDLGPDVVTYEDEFEISGNLHMWNPDDPYDEDPAPGVVVDLYTSFLGRVSKQASTTTDEYGDFSFTRTARSTATYFVQVGEWRVDQKTVAVREGFADLTVRTSRHSYDGRSRTVHISGQLRTFVPFQAVYAEIRRKHGERKWVALASDRTGWKNKEFHLRGDVPFGQQKIRISTWGDEDSIQRAVGRVFTITVK